MTTTSDIEQKLLDAISSLDKKIDVQFAELRGEIKRIDTRLDGIDKRIDGIDKRLDSLETQIKSQDNRLWVMVTGLFIALFTAIARTWFFPNT